jgi:hypothetical protein
LAVEGHDAWLGGFTLTGEGAGHKAAGDYAAMALTLTRTRTQTTLTKLALMVANVHGELEFLEGLLAQGVDQGCVAVAGGRAKGVGKGDLLTKEVMGRLLERQQVLHSNRDALYATVKRFDLTLEPAEIGSAQDWRLSYCRKGASLEKLVTRYLQSG